MPDIRKVEIMSKRMLVSRKRNRNLFDLTSLWKKVVIAKLDQEASNAPSTELHRNLNRRVDGDLEFGNFERILEL